MDLAKIAPKKILIINTFGIGDVLFTTPLVEELRRNSSTTFIGYLANRRTAPLLQLNPRIDKVFIYERDEFLALYRRSKWQYMREGFGLLNEIRREKFDLAVDCSLGTMSHLAWLAGIPVRVGYNYKQRGFSLTHKLPFKGYEAKHMVEYYADLLRAVGVQTQPRALVLVPPAADERWAEEWLKKKNLLHKKPLIAVLPGGGASWGKDAARKRWPAASYAQLVDKIIAQTSADIILMGDQNDRELCVEAARRTRHPCPVLAGETTLFQFAALLAHCDLAVVNDGGPLHIAVAVGVRTVSIFGPVDERVYGPFPTGNNRVVKKNLPCQPCYRRFRMSACSHLSCLNKLSVEDVFAQVERAL